VARKPPKWRAVRLVRSRKAWHWGQCAGGRGIHAALSIFLRMARAAASSPGKTPRFSVMGAKLRYVTFPFLMLADACRCRCAPSWEGPKAGAALAWRQEPSGLPSGTPRPILPPMAKKSEPPKPAAMEKAAQVFRAPAKKLIVTRQPSTKRAAPARNAPPIRRCELCPSNGKGDPKAVLEKQQARLR
jgi:hypothetical protein